MRGLLGMALALVVIVAQALFSAHAASGEPERANHVKVECAVCLAASIAPDPLGLHPKLSAPSLSLIAPITAIPDALLTEIAVRAASPRAPPLV